MPLDLTSLRSVDAFANDVLRRQLALRFLVCNAGIFAAPFALTHDGYESHFGVNHLGHFHLIRRLLPALEANAPSRIVCVTSDTYSASSLFGEDAYPLNQTDRHAYNPSVAYANSKYCNVVLAAELERRYASRGVHAFAAEPGMLRTHDYFFLSLQ